MGLNQRGGARIGSGPKKRKSLKKKVLEGDVKAPKVKSLKVVAEKIPKAKDYLMAREFNGKPLGAEKIYKDIYKWVCNNGCEKKINNDLLEQYAMARARWIQCQEAISQFGLLAPHPTTKIATVSPYVQILEKFEKLMNAVYFLIERQVREETGIIDISYDAGAVSFNELLD